VPFGRERSVWLTPQSGGKDAALTVLLIAEYGRFHGGRAGTDTRGNKCLSLGRAMPGKEKARGAQVRPPDRTGRFRQDGLRSEDDFREVTRRH